MNFIKRAFTSMFRKPGKTAILLLLIFVLCNVIAGAVSIKTALENTRHSLLEKMGAEVKIAVDYERIEEMGENFDYSSIGKMTKDIADDIASSELVKRSDYTLESYIGVKGVHYIYDDTETYEETGSAAVSEDGEIAEEEEYTEWFNFIGGITEQLKGVEDGKIKLADGRCYTADEIAEGAKVALVWDTFLEKNNLKIGDKLKVEYDVYNYYDYSESDEEPGDEFWEPTKIEDEIEIIGTFSTIDEIKNDKEGGYVYMENPYHNAFLTTGKTVENFMDTVNEVQKKTGTPEDELTSAQINVSFMIDSVDNLEIFKAQNKDKLPDFYKFTDNSDGFVEVEKPMKNMNMIANIILYVAVGATVLVIGLLVTLFLKDRTREMGIYMSLGERKWKIAVQILVEVMVIAIIAVTLSVFSGNVLAGKLGNGLLADQMSSSQNYGYWYGSTETIISGDDFQDEYKVTLDGRTVGFIYAVGLGSVLVSTMIPIVSTLSIKPKRILM